MTAIERLNKALVVAAEKYNVSVAFETEAVFKLAAIDYLELAGALVNREAWTTKNGTADIICCFYGRFIAFELKDNIGQASDQQLKYLDKVHKHGGRGCIARTIKDMHYVLESVCQDL